MTKLAKLLLVAGTALGSAATSPAAAAGPLQINATGSILYDSNQLRTTAVGGPSGQAHPDDLRYSPALSAIYDRVGGRATLSVNALVGRDFYQYNSKLDRNHFGAGGLLTYPLASCRATGSGNYSSRQAGTRDFGNQASPVVEPVVLPPDDVGRVIDNRQIATSYGAGVNCGSDTGRLSFGGNYNHSSLSNGAGIRRIADSNSDVFSGSVGIGILRPGQLQLVGSYSTIGYPNRSSTIGLPSPLPVALSGGVKTYRGGLTFTRPIGSRLSGSIGVSYLTARPVGPQTSYTSPAYNVSLTYTPGTRLAFTVLGSRDIIASTTVGALFRVVDIIRATASYDVSASISANLNLGLTSNNYQGAFAIAGEPARKTDSSKIVGVGISYSPRPLYNVGVFANETFRTANPNLFNYTSTRVGLTFGVHI